MPLKFLLAAMFLVLCSSTADAADSVCAKPLSVCEKGSRGSFPLIAAGNTAAVVIDEGANPAIRHAANGLAGDLARVSGKQERQPQTSALPGQPIVLITVIGQSPLLDQLINSGKIQVSDIAGRWETFRQVTVEQPFPGVPAALVIIGSDRRGAVFGTYDISEKIGVSPWHWWADVPITKRANAFVTAGTVTDAPKVKYRGIFINDEEPAFGGWARKKFGGVNADAYAHVFDLMLRLKANYLWPAMWGKAFNADDPRNMALADERGVVMGTSHHEPMMRAQREWRTPGIPGVTGGAWNYETNGANLQAFWRGGIERMASKGSGGVYESLVTVGMRGDGDEPMTEGTAITLLETIVADQRKTIADVTGRPASETPQVWALYKEVQDYYDHGMKVPDDVILLFADDNWGQIRRLPTTDHEREGGYGVYYHFDYVGGPRSYKWLNTTQPEKIWQQMDLAYQRGARALWIVNVGDLKPMEFPIDFFLKMAWNPEAMTAEAMAAFPRQWAERTFGTRLSASVGAIMTDYSKLAARRKPELVDADSYALGGATPTHLDGGEFARIVGEWDDLETRVKANATQLRPDQRDAFFQLVAYPVEAMANLHRLYYAVAWNRRLAKAEDPRANAFADRAEALFKHDAELRTQYHTLNRGKWDKMMAQAHFGYTSWQDPGADVMPKVERVSSSSVNRLVAAAPVSDAVSLDLDSFRPAPGNKGLKWRVIPNLGRTEGAIGVFPQGAPSTQIMDGIQVEYDVRIAKTADTIVRLYLNPALDTRGGNGLRIGVQLDDQPVQIMTMNLTVDGKDWTRAVKDNAFQVEARFSAVPAGIRKLRLIRLDDGVFVERIVIGSEPIAQSYLGPPTGPR